jgi:hypothetical protein
MNMNYLLTVFLERKINMTKIKDGKKLLLKLAMDNGKFIHTDYEGFEKLKNPGIQLVREYDLKTNIHAIWRGNMFVNPSHIAYAIPEMFYLVMEKNMK